jgi:hypothetical protein
MTDVAARRATERVADWFDASVRRTWWAAFALLLVLGGAWTLANPLYSGPDEPAHTIKAAAVVRGQLVGTERASDVDADNRVLYVTVPGVYFSDRTGCFAFHAEIPASCQHFEDDAPSGEMVTSAGRYPPLYYLFVGVASLPFPTSSGMYVMRMLGVALAAALIASALVSLRRLPDARFASLGLALAVTPMVLFVMGIINPSTPEIAGAIGTWASGYVLVTQASTRIDTRVLVRFGLAAAVLAFGRSLGPMWLFFIVAALLAVARPDDLRALVRSRATWLCALFVSACSIAQVLWVKLANPLGGVDPIRAIDQPFVSLFRTSIGASYGNELQMIGDFGWLDTVAPQITYVFWVALIAFVVVVAVSTARRWPALVLLGVMALVVLVPSLLDSMQAPKLGFIWQGRYTLPLGVGVPMLAACLAAGPRTRRFFRDGRFYLVCGAMLLVAQSAAFYQALRRNAVGEKGKLTFWTDPAAWSPPVPSLLLLIGFLIATGLFLWLVLAPVALTSELPGEPHDEAVEAGG